MCVQGCTVAEHAVSSVYSLFDVVTAQFSQSQRAGGQGVEVSGGQGLESCTHLTPSCTLNGVHNGCRLPDPHCPLRFY
jgi:hypothetical protein